MAKRKAAVKKAKRTTRVKAKRPAPTRKPTKVKVKGRTKARARKPRSSDGASPTFPDEEPRPIEAITDDDAGSTSVRSDGEDLLAEVPEERLSTEDADGGKATEYDPFMTNDAALGAPSPEVIAMGARDDSYDLETDSDLD